MLRHTCLRFMYTYSDVSDFCFWNQFTGTRFHNLLVKLIITAIMIIETLKPVFICEIL